MQEEKDRWCFAMVTQRLDISSGTRRRSQEKVSILCEYKLFQPLPVSQSNSRTFRFKDIQKIMLLILSCKTMGFTEYIYRVGNAIEMNSTIRSGLIPGGRSLKRGSQSVFFTMTNPMENDNGMGETPCDLTSQGSLHTKIFGNLFKTLFIGAI